MADPLSIVVGVSTLIQVSVKVTLLLKQFRDDVNVVDAALNGLLNDVEGFQQVMVSMRETFSRDEIKATLQVTGHVGNHWRNLARSLNDGTGTLQELHTLLSGVNKTTSFLDGPRKQLRLKTAVDQMALYREQIQSYRAAMQLSLSTVILWNQVTFQTSAEQIPDKIIPNLDRLYDEFRSLGLSLNAKIENLQTTMLDQNGQSRLNSMHNLRDCVRSAADVVSTASSTLTVKKSDGITFDHGSDFGDIFPRHTNETMVRWMDSRTVYEYDGVEGPTPIAPETITRRAPNTYYSDDDSDIEQDMMKALYDKGKNEKSNGDIVAAERLFRNCMNRLPPESSSSPNHGTSVKIISKSNLLDLLADCYIGMGQWDKAKASMIEKLSIKERQVGKKDEKYLSDTLGLAIFLMEHGDYTEAHLQARRALRGFKKLGPPGSQGYERSLRVLVGMCRKEGKTDEEEGYAALLGNHLAKQDRSSALKARESGQASLSGSTSTSGVVHKQLPETLESIKATLARVELEPKTSVVPAPPAHLASASHKKLISSSEPTGEGPVKNPKENLGSPVYDEDRLLESESPPFMHMAPLECSQGPFSNGKYRITRGPFTNGESEVFWIDGPKQTADTAPAVAAPANPITQGIADLKKARRIVDLEKEQQSVSQNYQEYLAYREKLEPSDFRVRGFGHLDDYEKSLSSPPKKELPSHEINIALLGGERFMPIVTTSMRRFTAWHENSRSFNGRANSFTSSIERTGKNNLPCLPSVCFWDFTRDPSRVNIKYLSKHVKKWAIVLVLCDYTKFQRMDSGDTETPLSLSKEYMGDTPRMLLTVKGHFLFSLLNYDSKALAQKLEAIDHMELHVEEVASP
ncbi:hypothetical protein P154DRAFT_574562 [Amniculicola lignicola CBS 123094]|uniref:Fungal N-terminal domain-containing protein n=1 Tax=Amniculicola lignicola CBS 123094 TaxID=1392246 RepID=A0A6A5WS41_9PLEO|nr:hypothetical protein P154DRAFT_574562 [Amniculicola lignicola CBS 123094]